MTAGHEVGAVGGTGVVEEVEAEPLGGVLEPAAVGCRGPGGRRGARPAPGGQRRGRAEPGPPSRVRRGCETWGLGDTARAGISRKRVHGIDDQGNQTRHETAPSAEPISSDVGKASGPRGPFNQRGRQCPERRCRPCVRPHFGGGGGGGGTGALPIDPFGGAPVSAVDLVPEPHPDRADASTAASTRHVKKRMKSSRWIDVEGSGSGARRVPDLAPIDHLAVLHSRGVHELIPLGAEPRRARADLARASRTEPSPKAN